jgi:hypothetical protein
MENSLVILKVAIRSGSMAGQARAADFGRVGFQYNRRVTFREEIFCVRARSSAPQHLFFGSMGRHSAVKCQAAALPRTLAG